ncbi:hypothetical protein PhiCh1p68 [Natrialba phage PhiCh1]|uniref:Virus protein phiCh1-VP67 n=2 Tax=root TaxID=1 RepID=D3T2B8_NATMM|nr:hypothetical protein [Natrialba magadii]NP_665985.1 hypothetical protein PhiCh1p68 [Natrialba phage PhiCh1]YP_010078093.1 CxxC motif protein [Natrialba phage PhiCh1]AAM88741.1 unknown [Natrialba phage PhiCh1]ADD07727.1 virus protein phiCh1-VP67 [Natrialba magadii ATCC 43099]ELY22974.1 hypothetical protein C500_20960 [Natrialba magadii ATCC 43099]QBJ01244.1 CxxC motif protein [Natrialba phage PhiCh1]
MNKETGEVNRPSEPAETSEQSETSKTSKSAENCARCGKPLGSTVHPTMDGASCHSCYNDQEPTFLGVVNDWEFQSAAQSDDVLPSVIITLTNDDQTAITVTDREQAKDIGPEMVGKECWDHGDEWKFNPVDAGDSDDE